MAIGTFGSFTQARLAIYASQTGLSITGNNISNINTLGYTRQRLDQDSIHIGGTDRYANPADVRTGQGVLCSGVSQLRDPYLDIRYRTTNSEVGYMDTTLGGLEDIARILDEVGKGEQTEGEGFGILGAKFSELFKVLENLTTETGHGEFDRQVKSTAEELVRLFNKYSGDLQQEYDSAINAFETDVTKVNGILSDIRSLNEEIRRCEIYGDNALELRDHRNVLLDELSEYVKIDAYYTTEEIAPGVTVGKLIVKLDDANPDGKVTTDETSLIDGIYAGKLSINKVPQANPEYQGKYLTESGRVTDDETKAAQVPKLNPAYDKTLQPGDPNYQGKYLLPNNGGWTDDETQAEMEPQANENYTPNVLPYLDSKGNPTDDETKAMMVYGDNFDITVSELRDSKGRLMYTQTPTVTTEVTDAAEQAIAKAYIEGGRRTPNESVKGNTTTYTSYIEKDGKYFKVTYDVVGSEKVALDDNDLYGALQAERELLTESGDFADLETITGTDLSCDEKAGAKRGFRYYQKCLDLLANKLATSLNEANQGFYVDDKGNYIGTALDENGVPKVDEVSGKVIGATVDVTYTDAGGAEQTYTLKKGDTKESLDAIDPNIWTAMEDEAQKAGKTIETVEDYLKLPKMIAQTDENGDPVVDGAGNPVMIPATDENGNEYTNATFVGGPLFSNHGSGNNTTDPQITASNISISYGWNYDNVQIIRSYECPPGEAEPASGDSDNILHMLGLQNEKMNYIPNELESDPYASGEVMFRGSFSEFWENIGSVLANDQNITSTMLDTAYTSALEIDTARDSVSAVDFNDEAMNLMMYAKSYNAACRLMTTIDTVLDKLINNTGMTT